MQGSPTESDILKIPAYKNHVHLFQTQFGLYSEQLNSLPRDKVFLIFDYSTIHETAKFKLKDLNFTAYWKDKEKLWHTYFDFWSTSKKDYNFTLQAFHSLLDLPFFRQFNEAIVWGDGGLKTKEILYYFSVEAERYNLPLCMNYFAPHHGHSVCDAHFGVGKRALRQTVGVRVVESQDQVITAFSSVTNTAPGFLLGEINTIQPHVQAFPELIRKYYQFYLRETGQIWCRESWKSKIWVLQKITVLDEKLLAERRDKLSLKKLDPVWQKQEAERKQDPVWKLTIPELKAELNRQNIPFSSKDLKPDLINLLKQKPTVPQKAPELNGPYVYEDLVIRIPQSIVHQVLVADQIIAKFNVTK
jgi:hypothetical protein